MNRPNPVGSADVRETMVRFVSEGTHAFIVSHSEGLFGVDSVHPKVTDTVAEGLAQAIHRRDAEVRQPLAVMVAIRLLKSARQGSHEV